VNTLRIIFCVLYIFVITGCAKVSKKDVAELNQVCELDSGEAQVAEYTDSGSA
jgi:hypothetical protein